MRKAVLALVNGAFWHSLQTCISQPRRAEQRSAASSVPIPSGLRSRTLTLSHRSLTLAGMAARRFTPHPLHVLPELLGAELPSPFRRVLALVLDLFLLLPLTVAGALLATLLSFPTFIAPSLRGHRPVAEIYSHWFSSCHPPPLTIMCYTDGQQVLAGAAMGILDWFSKKGEETPDTAVQAGENQGTEDEELYVDEGQLARVLKWMTPRERAELDEAMRTGVGPAGHAERPPWFARNASSLASEGAS